MTEGLSARLAMPHAEAVARVRDALADQGFGVLTEIDVKATMKAKLDADFEDFVILGACNPPLARQALDLDRQVAAFLPCNVVVRTDSHRTEGDHTIVEAADPEAMVTVTGNPQLDSVAVEAGARLRAAVAALADQHQPELTREALSG